MSPTPRIPQEELIGVADLPQVVILEAEGRWATRLLQLCPQLPRQSRWRETRSSTECMEAIQSVAGSLVILEARSDLPRAPLKPESAVRYVARLGRSPWQPRVVLVGGVELAPWQNLLRECGALEVIVSLRQLETILPLIGKHAACFRPAEVSLRERIWAHLPWSTSD